MTRIENSAHDARRGWYDQSFRISGACLSYLETRTTPTVSKPLSCSTSAMKYWIINVLGSCPRFARTKQSTLMTKGCVESSLNDPGLRILHVRIVFNDFWVIVAVDWRVRRRQTSPGKSLPSSALIYVRLLSPGWRCETTIDWSPLHSPPTRDNAR